MVVGGGVPVRPRRRRRELVGGGLDGSSERGFQGSWRVGVGGDTQGAGCFQVAC